MPSPPRLLLISGAVAAALLGSLATLRPPEPRFPGPRTILWAWERPEDLRFLDTRATGVAFLAQTIRLEGGEVRTSRRRQPLLVPPGTYLIAVTRIETRGQPLSSTDQVSWVSDAIVNAASLPAVRAVQVDFDARESERDFYRDVLRQVRDKLPRATPLSITALASWCIGDRWLAGMEFDEAVPMLFQMGPDDRAVREHLRSGGSLAAPCRGQAGFATGEARPVVAAGARTYWFSPKPWTREQVARLEERQ